MKNETIPTNDNRMKVRMVKDDGSFRKRLDILRTLAGAAGYLGHETAGNDHGSLRKTA